MSRVIVYSSGSCSFCARAKILLEKLNIEFDEISLDFDPAARLEFTTVTNGAQTVPQIIIDGQLIGGFSELTELHMDGELDQLIPAD